MRKNAKENMGYTEVTREGTNQVKELNLPVDKYELFKANVAEIIFEMFTRFIKIVNNLKALGVDMPNSDLVKQCLPLNPRSWELKVTAKLEKDLTMLKLEQFIRSLNA